MKRFMLIIFVTIAFSSTLKADEIFYDITFSSPEHTVGHVPATGNSPTKPSQIVFGKPIVSSSLGLLQDQPLVFNTTGNTQPCCYYDQIALDMDRGRGFYYTSFDVLTHNFIGSRNKFTLLYDMPSVHNISFRNNGMINLFSRKDIPFQDNNPMHFEILMDLSNDYAKIFIDGQLVYDDELLLYGNRYDPEDYNLISLRFSHGLQFGTGGPDGSSSIALDNIIVADHVVSRSNAPFAIAGPNQVVYAYPDGFADITLDGSDSNDPDGDELTYQWIWTIDNTIYDTNGINPTIELPVGEHTVTLVVNDGVVDSEPDQLTITVIEPIESKLRILPRTLNRHSKQKYIFAFMRLPEGITRDQVADEKLLLYPDVEGDTEGDGIEASRQLILRRFINGAEQVIILALFDRAALTSVIPENGRTELEVSGKLTTGQVFYGEASVNIIDPKNRPRPNANRYRRRRR